MTENNFAILNHVRKVSRLPMELLFFFWSALTSMSTKLKIGPPNPINVFLDSFVTEIKCEIEQIWRIGFWQEKAQRQRLFCLRFKALCPIPNYKGF